MNPVCGVDVSLTSTGVAFIDPDTGTLDADTIRSRGRATDRLPENLERIAHLGDTIAAAIIRRSPPLVVIESALFTAADKDSSAHRRAGLWWTVAQHLRAAGVPMIEVAPSELKKFTTGSGNASKADMLRCLDHDWPGHGVSGAGKYDVADAAYLASMGVYGLGGTLPDRLGANAYRTATVDKAMNHRTLKGTAT